jgi:hypothetical protein
MEHYQGPKARFIRTCEGYVRSKALDLEDNDYDNEWHKGLDNEAPSLPPQSVTYERDFQTQVLSELNRKS